MKYVPLIWAGVWRKPVRSLLTMLSIIVAFTLFGLLKGIDATFRHAESAMRSDILHTIPRFSSPLPYSYIATVAAISGVARVMPSAEFRGSFQDPLKTVFGEATHPEQWFASDPLRRSVPTAQLNGLLRTRTGVIVGGETMRKYGWKIGDRIPIQSNIARIDESTVWTFDIVGVYVDTLAAQNADELIFNYEYLDQGRAQGKGTIEDFTVQVVDPKRMPEIQEAIDKAFSNSSAETRTFSEIEFLNHLFAQVGDISFMVTAIVGVTFFVLLFLTTNTMVQSVRERIPEFAVMKTVGFSDQGVLGLIVAESLVICLVGAAIGLGIAWYVYPIMVDLNGVHLPLPFIVVAAGSGIAIGVSILSALPGVWTIARMTIVQALAEQT